MGRTARGAPRRTVSSTPCPGARAGTTDHTGHPQCSEQGAPRGLTLQARTLTFDRQCAPDKVTRRRRAQDPSPLPRPGGLQMCCGGSGMRGHPRPGGESDRSHVQNQLLRTLILKCKRTFLVETAELLRECMSLPLSMTIPPSQHRQMHRARSGDTKQKQRDDRGVVTSTCPRRTVCHSGLRGHKGLLLLQRFFKFLLMSRAFHEKVLPGSFHVFVRRT